MVKYIFLFLSIVSIYHSGYGQTIDLTMKIPGLLITQANDSIHGSIAVSSDRKTLMLSQQNNLRHFSANQIKRVVTPGGELVTAVVAQETEERIFNVVVKGQITLLALPSEESGELIFYQLEGEVAELIEVDEKAFFNIFGKERKTISAFAYSHALNPELPEDLKVIFDYFSTLLEAD